MSTRAVIARKSGFGFTGRYHHWDGYPSGLGKALFHAYKKHFKKDTEKMLKFLIDDHPAGWSTIVGKDLSIPPGYLTDYEEAKGHPFENRALCYCHGDRSETSDGPTTDKTASGSGCEYAYVFPDDGKTMQIYSSYHKDGGKMIGAFGSGDPDSVWRIVESVDLDGREPDWEELNERARA